MSLAISCALALGLASGIASAQMKPADTNYLTEQSGTVVRSGYGLCWHTGTGPAVSKSECEAPSVQAAVPAPQLAVATPKAVPVAKKITLDADMLFDFDKSVLRPAGVTALDGFVNQIQDIDPEIITAVGHADRFGTQNYNQVLSEQRVAVVKNYLVGKGIKADRIHTEGRGEMQPFTDARDCDGVKSAKVIACLQADRRVEIEVVGTKINK
jgi:OmpA-OmpF porin, OOP family